MYEKLGDVGGTAGALDDARGWFEKSLAVREALAASVQKLDDVVSVLAATDANERATQLVKNGIAPARGREPSSGSATSNTPLSDLISLIIANPSSSQAIALFHETVLESTLGVIALGGAAWQGEFRTIAKQPALASAVTADGRKMISACADRAAFVRRFDPRYNAEMRGRDVLTMALMCLDCEGVWVNSAASSRPGRADSRTDGADPPMRRGELMTTRARPIC